MGLMEIMNNPNPKKDVKIIRVKTSDNRSYHISSEKIKKEFEKEMLELGYL